MKFTIGNTLNEGFSLLSKHFAKVFLVGILTYALPIVIGAILLAVTTGFNIATNPDPTTIDSVWWSSFGIYMVITVIASLISFSMITEVVINERFALGGAFVRALKNLIPLIVISILLSLAIMLGMILLIVPGIIVTLMFYVVMTAYIAEPGLGILGAFKRSRELTKGHRWGILAIVLIVAICIAILNMIVALPLGLSAPGEAGPVVIALSAFISAVTTIISLVFTIAIYTSLRRAKDTHTPETVAEVFS